MIRKPGDRHHLYRAWRFAHSGLSELPETRHRERSGFALGQTNSAPLRRALEWSPTQSIVTLTSFLLLSKSWKRELNKLNQRAVVLPAGPDCTLVLFKTGVSDADFFGTHSLLRTQAVRYHLLFYRMCR